MPLSTNTLSFHYIEDKPVLRAISFVPRVGAVTGILGPNGAGKSTLLRLLLGVLLPSSGSVTLDGRAVSSLPHLERARRIAYIPQRTSPAFGYSVEECVQMGGLAQGSRASTAAALERVGLLDRSGDVFDTLSAGQQQRAILARALVQLGSTGTVLLADEPVSAMDPRQSLQAMSILKQKAADGLAIVAVLHDLALAESFCDDVAILTADGRMAAHGPAHRTLTPEVLDAVFDVRFRRSDRILVPSLPHDASNTRIEGT